MRGPAVNHALASDLNWPSEAVQPLKAGRGGAVGQIQKPPLRAVGQ